MIWSCRRVPCPCASSKAQDAAECWCVLVGEFYRYCVRCAEPMRKTSPGVPVASGIREGERIKKL